MKKRNLLINLLTITLGLGVFTAVSSRKEVTKTNATGEKYIFVQVKRVEDLQLDDVVIMACGNQAIGGLGGNPCYTYGNSVGNNSGDYSKYNFENSSALTMKVEVGMDGGLSTYSFKSLRTEQQEKDLWLKTYNKYLAYIPNNHYGEDGHNIQTHGDIAFTAAKDEYSSWNVAFDNDGFAYLSRKNEDNRYGKEGVTNPISIKYQGGTARSHFGYYFGSTNVRLYRRVNIASSNLDVYINKEPTQLSYIANEPGNLAGMEITFTTKDTYMSFKSIYDEEPGFYTIDDIYYDEDHSRLPFSWLGVEEYVTVSVEVDHAGENNYTKRGESFSDLRGSFILGAQHNGQTAILDLSKLSDKSGADDQSGKTVFINGENDTICDTIYDTQAQPVTVEEVANNVVKIVYEDGYYVKIGSEYLCFKKHYLGDYGYIYKGDKSESLPAYLDLNNIICFNFDGEKSFLTYDPYTTKFFISKESHKPSNEEDVELYRLNLKTEHITEMNYFMAGFYANTSTCDATGETNGLSLENWATLEESYNTMRIDSQRYLADIVYSHNNEKENTLRDMIDRYDHIVSKYEKDGFNDFMFRSVTHDLASLSQSAVVKSINVDTNASTIMIVVVALTSISSIGVLLVIKKRRAFHK